MQWSKYSAQNFKIWIPIWMPYRIMRLNHRRIADNEESKRIYWSDQRFEWIQVWTRCSIMTENNVLAKRQVSGSTRLINCKFKCDWGSIKLSKIYDLGNHFNLHKYLNNIGILICIYMFFSQTWFLKILPQ